MLDRRSDILGAVLDWYFARYHRTDDDLGTADTFVSRALVGQFAAPRRAFEHGEGAALMKVFIACVFFQKRQDQQVLRILRGMQGSDAMALHDIPTLERQLRASRCECLRTLDSLGDECGLTKDPSTGLGTCQFPARRCHLKRHTVLMKRYGHFGKVPTSVLLMLREKGVSGLPALRRGVLRRSSDPADRSRELQAALMRCWRVSSKISSMFLSAVSTPDLGRVRPPWLEGVAGEEYVVVDSNTDRFLALLGHDSAETYEERRRHVIHLARGVDLRRHGDVALSYNPRLLQQAMYVFMGKVSRRANPRDCCNKSGACSACPKVLRKACPFG